MRNAEKSQVKMDVLCMVKIGNVLLKKPESLVLWRRLPKKLESNLSPPVRVQCRLHFRVIIHATGAVAIAYVMHKTTHVFPVIGGRKVEHLEQNTEALTISLSPEQIKFLEDEAPPFDPGFPNTLIVSRFLLMSHLI